MKRLISLALALLLALSAAGAALAEGIEFKTNYFTLNLPDQWAIRTDGAGKEKDEDLEFLGYCYAKKEKGLVVEAYLMYYKDFADLSLWDADEETIALYVQSVLEDYEDDAPEFLGIVTAGSIPFVLIRAEDEDGEYLYADTMTNGYAIMFWAYVTDYDAEFSYPLRNADIELFKSILETFQPVSGS